MSLGTMKMARVKRRTLVKTTGLLAMAVLTLASSAWADDVAISDKARQHFQAGVNYLQDPDGARYEDAYAEFKAAYTESPSWKILGNLGIAAMKLERDGEAADAFEKYLAQGGSQIEADERAQFERDLQTLKASIARVTITSNAAGVMLSDQRVPVRGEPIVNEYGPVQGTITLGIRPGHHKITARLAGYAEATWEFEATPTSTQTHQFTMTQGTGAGAAGPAAGGGDQGATGGAGRPMPVGVYVGLAATGVLLVGGTVTGVLALGKKKDFDAANDGTDPQKAEDLRNSGKTLNLVTDILLGGAVVAGVVTAVLFVNRPQAAPEAEKGTAFHFTPVIGRNSGGLSLSGRF